MNLTRGINLRKIAELMPGASGAEVKVTETWGPQEQEALGSLGDTGQQQEALRANSQGPSSRVSASLPTQGVCTEAGMYALRERRVHVTQEDFEMAVAKVCASTCLSLLRRLWSMGYYACVHSS